MPIPRFIMATFAALIVTTSAGFAETRGAATFDIVQPEPVRQDVLIPPLLGPNDLKNLMQVATPYVIDVRNTRAKNALYSYAAGHIPDSVNVPYGAWRGLWNDPLSIPTDAELTELVQSSGIPNDRPIVIVHSSAAKGNFGSAAFVYWTLKSAGFTNMAILNGGIRGWRDSGGEISKTPTPITATSTRVVLNPAWLATHEDIDAVLDGTSQAQLLDARPLHQIMESASLDGSFMLNANELVSGANATAVSDQSIFMRIKQADLDWEYNDVITYCNNGALAAVDWFMASEIAEIPNVRIYAHSLNARQRAQSLWNKVAN